MAASASVEGGVRVPNARRQITEFVGSSDIEYVHESGQQLGVDWLADQWPPATRLAFFAAAVEAWGRANRNR